MASSMICFRCGYEGHTAKYGTGKGTKNPVESPRGPDSGERTVQTCSQAKANASTSRDAGTSNTVVTGTLSILEHYALTLFDSGSTHSFISMPFVSQTGFTVKPLLHVLFVSTQQG